MERIGILHPGEMGISVAASGQSNGHEVYWVSDGRSAQTRARVEKHPLLDAHTLTELCRTCSIIIGVCPPHAAEEIAQQVLAHAFSGLYVDVNAISPQRANRIEQAMRERGVEFVDGGIIGGPAWKPDTTWLYLSGCAADRVAGCFVAGPLQAKVIGEEIGKASALKMCFSAYSKGTSALLGAVLGASEALGVRGELESHWNRGDAAFAEKATQRVQGTTKKAWRFVSEMEEIAATFKEAGLPDGFHLAAANVYSRLADFKGDEAVPSIERVLDALRQGTSQKAKG
jgi:3-hydroxyisobutyrate dehydrogenase-like beta-hydroxyacid dehydrogenase